MCRHITGASTLSYLCKHLHLQQNLQRAQTCTVARSSWSEGHNCLATVFWSLSFFYFFYALYLELGGEGGSHEVFSISSFFSVSFLYAVYNGYLAWPLFPGPIHHVHLAMFMGGVGDITLT
jgi:hypothetical protein